MEVKGNPNLVEIEHLRKIYGSLEAVKNLSLSVSAGEIFALLGPNGAGKTTLIRMLMGILIPTSGSARINGLDCIVDRIEVKRQVGYVPDEPVFYDYLRGRELIQFTGEMHGLSRSEIEHTVRPLAQRLELTGALEQFTNQYSRGTKKKLALICAMLHDPALLILDEPASGLDPVGSRVLHEIIQEKANEGKAIFFSTHLLDQAEKLCSNIAIISKGELVACGTLAQLKRQFLTDGSLEQIFFSVAGNSPTIVRT